MTARDIRKNPQPNRGILNCDCINGKCINMKWNFFLLLFCVFIIACSDNEETGLPMDTPESTAINILPLGASRVQGARPVHESYRYELWQLIINAESNIDFIGNEIDASGYSDIMGQSFDRDHEGHGGFTSAQILARLEGWLEDIPVPDIVLFSSPGGNDALGGLPFENIQVNVNAIIDMLQDRNPSVTIIIEKLAPARSDLMTGQLLDYFVRMQDEVDLIAADQTTDNSKVIVVDMATGFQDNMLADAVHYNTTGAKFIAVRYFTVLQDLLN